ncbi:hypothetical protein JOB18_016715 [Solea senegalensis]|uniref:Uncharacterized protein n=1 Tax=Solea senegalensis TaxID=28829 RepID=A0AAV6PLA7_SOLSE|nr:hypothetical protein JOB18_016715 [Solea senegalensis]
MIQIFLINTALHNTVVNLKALTRFGSLYRGLPAASICLKQTSAGLSSHASRFEQSRSCWWRRAVNIPPSQDSTGSSSPQCSRSLTASIRLMAV